MENSSFMYGQRRKVKEEASLQRSRAEIAELYSRHVGTVYGVCFSMLGSKADAEDATQGVFLKLLKDGTCFSSEEHERAWLITTARNQCRDMLRQWWRKRVAGLENAERACEAFDAGSPVLEAVMRLPPKLRVLVYLHYYEGYKLTEIADMLRLNLNTVKTRMKAARKRLKIELGDDFDA